MLDATGDIGDVKATRMPGTEAGREITTRDVPPSAVPLIRALLKELGGGGVTVIADGAEITTQQAAELLVVSRPYLVGMINKGELPARKVGPRRTLLIADVLGYRAETKAKRHEALRTRRARSGVGALVSVAFRIADYQRRRGGACAAALVL